MREQATTPLHFGHDQVGRFAPVEIVGPVLLNASECAGQVLLYEQLAFPEGRVFYEIFPGGGIARKGFAEGVEAGGLFAGEAEAFFGQADGRFQHLGAGKAAVFLMG